MAMSRKQHNDVAEAWCWKREVPEAAKMRDAATDFFLSLEPMVSQRLHLSDAPCTLEVNLWIWM